METVTSLALRAAGDVHIKDIQMSSLNGKTVNITNQVQQIEVFEDLFSSFITMSIGLIEAVDYINYFPFSGDEYLDVDIDTPTLQKPIKGRFYIYKIDSYIKTTDRECAYVIRVISEEWYRDANTKISKGYNGNVAVIAEKLLGKDGLATTKKTNIESTISTTRFVSNFWQPSKCLNYIATNAVSAVGSPSYLFFENRNGFNFIAVDTMLNADVSFKFVKDNFSRDLTNGLSTAKDPNKDFQRIMQFDIPVLTNYMEDVQSGRIKSRMVTHDIVTKKYTSTDYSLKKDPKPHKLLNANPGYSKYTIDSPASTMILMPKYYSNFTNFTDVTTSKTAQKRMSFFQNLKKYSVNMQVLGRTDYTVGMIVDVSIPRAGQITSDDPNPLDLTLSGKYIVSAINHTIDRESHTCTMEIIKNSMLLNLSTQ